MTVAPAAGERTLQRLWDLEEIKQLKSRYFQAVDEKDFEAFETLFTEDAVVDFSGEIPHRIGHNGLREADADPAAWRVRGGAAAGAVIAESVRELVTVHQGHDPQIEWAGDDDATGRWSMSDIMVFEHETMYGFGHYLERYRRIDGSWRIAELVLTRLRVEWALNATG